MTQPQFHPLLENVTNANWPRRWLQLAVFALALAGVFAVVLVVARTPQLIALAPWMKQLFQLSLVIHVDLSVLVWFLASAGMLWSMLHHRLQANDWPFFHGASWWCMLVGTLLIAASPLSDQWEVIKSNYIPVITNELFFTGLALVMASVVIGVLHMLPLLGQTSDPIEWGLVGSVIAALVAMGAFVASAWMMPSGIEGHAFYEHVFWAGGHVLQFVYMQLLLVAWALMAMVLGYQLPPRAVLFLLMAFGPVFTLFTPIPYMIHSVSDQEHMRFFTLHMDVFLGVGGAVFGLYLLVQMIRSQGTPKAQRAVKYCLLMSLLLFGLGGLLGAMIRGANTGIPAHYHGAIVSVTLALMGLAYVLLPRFGYADVGNWRLARWQPWVLAVGQWLHVIGLAWSGGYGVLRKTIADVGTGGWQVKAALGMLGGGGLIAAIGGVLFVIVMLKAMRRRGAGNL